MKYLQFLTGFLISEWILYIFEGYKTMAFVMIFGGFVIIVANNKKYSHLQEYIQRYF